jgi:hypothetical protein
MDGARTRLNEATPPDPILDQQAAEALFFEIAGLGRHCPGDVAAYAPFQSFDDVEHHSAASAPHFRYDTSPCRGVKDDDHMREQNNVRR